MCVCVRVRHSLGCGPGSTKHTKPTELRSLSRSLSIVRSVDLLFFVSAFQNGAFVIVGSYDVYLPDSNLCWRCLLKYLVIALREVCMDVQGLLLVALHLDNKLPVHRNTSLAVLQACPYHLVEISP